MIHVDLAPEPPDFDRELRQPGLAARDCRELRGQYAVDYWEDLIKLPYLERRAPFVAMELRRQRRLRPGDV